jgi:hypothetical protein
MKKVVVFQPHAGSSPHFETALEIIQKNIKLGNEVYFIGCNSGLTYCELNRNHNLQTCFQCLGKKTHGLSLIDGAFKNVTGFFSLTREEKKYIDTFVLNFKNIEELKQYKIDDFDIGMASASSLISKLRDARPNINNHKELLLRIIKSGLLTYFSFKSFLKQIQPDLVYMHNARFANIRGVLRLCVKHKIDFKVFDRGSDVNKYLIVENHQIHDIEHFGTTVINHWKKEPSEFIKNQIAEKYFVDKKESKINERKNFLSQQERHTLPNKFDHNKRNVVIFTSSEDEFESVGADFNRYPFNNQLEAIQYISQKCNIYKNLQIYVRMHPNSNNEKSNFASELILEEGLSVILPNSEISSYALLEAADLIITFGSSISIEADFWRKPNIMIGTSFWDSLGIGLKIKNKQELVDLILNYNKTRPILGALMLGYYFSTFGEEFKYYKGLSFYDGEFKGKKLIDNSLLSLLYSNKILRRVIKKAHKKIVGSHI